MMASILSGAFSFSSSSLSKDLNRYDEIFMIILLLGSKSLSWGTHGMSKGLRIIVALAFPLGLGMFAQRCWRDQES